MSMFYDNWQQQHLYMSLVPTQQQQHVDKEPPAFTTTTTWTTCRHRTSCLYNNNINQRLVAWNSVTWWISWIFRLSYTLSPKIWYTSAPVTAKTLLWLSPTLFLHFSGMKYYIIKSLLWSLKKTFGQKINICNFF